MKIIRIWGLVLLIILSILLWGVSSIWLDGWIKSSVENSGSKVNGATVDLNNASLSFLKGEISLQDLALADPDNLLINRLALEELTMDIDVLPLLKGFVHVDQLTIRNVAVNQPRKIKAEKVHSETVSAVRDWGASTALEIKNVDAAELLNKVDIQSPTQYQQFSSKLKSKQMQWKNELNNLPDKADIEKHKKDFQEASAAVKKAKGLGKLEALKKLKKVTKRINQDKKKVNQFAQKVKNDKRELMDEYKSLEQQVEKDAELAMSIVSLDPEGIQHLAANLLGENMASWLMLVVNNMHYLKKLSSTDKDQDTPPDMNSLKGVNVYFGKESPQDVLIKQALIEGAFNLGKTIGVIKGEAKNLASSVKLGKPLSLNSTISFPNQKVSDTKKNKVTKADVSLKVYNLNEQDIPVIANISLQQWPVEEWLLSDNGLKISNAVLGGDIKATANSNNIILQSQMLLSEFSIGGLTTSASKIESSLHSILKKVDKIEVSVELEIGEKQTKLRMRSNLDKLLYSRVKSEFEEKSSKIKAQVSQSIESQLKDIKASISQQFNGLNDLESQLNLDVESLSKLK